MKIMAILVTVALAVCQVPSGRLLTTAQEPQNWLMYNGTYSSQHYSGLDQIAPGNVNGLDLKWVWQAQSLDKFETTPLVLDGVMYLTEPPNNIVAIDARTGRVFWTFTYSLPAQTYSCCGKVNRGLAIHGNTLFMATLDAHLIAVDASTGKKKWDVTVVDYTQGYALTHAPLVIKDKVIVGTAGGEYGIRGFLAAYDVQAGRLAWKFYTIPGPGEPGHETWKNDAWKTGGGSIWITGSYDPDLNLTYWGIGNPGPDWNPAVRPGDNLYTDSLVALDADTGKLKWHFQFTPNDEWDFDAVNVPVLAEMEWKGEHRRLLLTGNRNGFFYVLDRTNGKFLLGRPFVKETWASGLDANGRPIKVPNKGPSEKGTETWPGVQGGTNWYAPSFSPRTKLFYLTAWENYHSTYYSWQQDYGPGKWYGGGTTKGAIQPTHREAIYRNGPESGYAVVRALDPRTGEKVWDFNMIGMSESGLLTTGGDLLFSGNREGYFFALDARSGQLLWKRYLGGQVIASPITYLVDGKQYVSIASGHSLFTFGLPQQ